jgi:menaquinone-9 beta-reductase
MNGADKTYDCAVIGGGLAGLCLSIQLARLGRSVVVFEKHKYPFHKVCGEYVSNESAGFLLRLGLRLDEWDLPQINRLSISSEEGYRLSASLGLGGFGISRHLLDHELVKIARQDGVAVVDGTKVREVSGGVVATSAGTFQARVCVGAFGKANPLFARQNERNRSSTDNYIAVKYHVRAPHQNNTIELHNFRKGYCGFSRIEADRYCLCYLSHNSNLLQEGADIGRMEEKVLMKNPHLKKIFSGSEFLFDRPLVVSNVQFGSRKTSDDHMLFIGDAAGCISPLTGNGMSMCGYSSVLLTGLVHKHLQGDISRDELRSSYQDSWTQAFGQRIRRGRQLQRLFGRPYLSDIALRVLNPLEKVKHRLIASTHGVPF